jgi:hypothetical protein
MMQLHCWRAREGKLAATLVVLMVVVVVVVLLLEGRELTLRQKLATSMTTLQTARTIPIIASGKSQAHDADDYHRAVKGGVGGSSGSVRMAPTAGTRARVVRSRVHRHFVAGWERTEVFVLCTALLL